MIFYVCISETFDYSVKKIVMAYEYNFVMFDCDLLLFEYLEQKFHIWEFGFHQLNANLFLHEHLTLQVG